MSSKKRNQDSHTDEKPKKRLCVFRDEWLKEEEWLKPCIGNIHKASCKYCNKDFSIAHGGRSDVTQHSAGAEHKKNKVTVASSSNLKRFFANTTSPESDKLALAELTSVFHTVKHNLSYNSMDCGHKLLPKLYEDSKVATKVCCGRTKAEAIVKNVLCPMYTEIVLTDLKDNNFFSIATDSSNKGNRKFHPVCVQYFTKEKGICRKLLDFIEAPHETSDSIVSCIKASLTIHNLSLNNVSAFSADNTNANMGKTRSAFTLLRDENPRMLKAGCLCHVINNAFRHAMDKLDVDVESTVLRIFSHFSSSAVRRDNLKDFFEFVDIEYKELLRHVPTRWLSLAPAIDRLIRNWPALMTYFISEKNNIPKPLKRLLFLTEDSSVQSLQENEVTIALHFISNVSVPFEAASKKFQNEETTATELYDVMLKLINQLESRQTDKFYGSFATKALNKLSDDIRLAMANDLNAFLETAINYCKKWFDFSEENPFYYLRAISLNQEVSFESLTRLVDLLHLEEYIDVDNMYEEFTIVRNSLKVLTENKEMDVGSKWHMLFTKNMTDLPNIFKLVSFCLCIPPSNAFVERVFSHMNLKWTDVRNRCTPELIKSELIVAINSTEESCADFIENIKSSKNFRKTIEAVKSNKKY